MILTVNLNIMWMLISLVSCLTMSLKRAKILLYGITWQCSHLWRGNFCFLLVYYTPFNKTLRETLLIYKFSLMIMINIMWWAFHILHINSYLPQTFGTFYLLTHVCRWFRKSLDGEYGWDRGWSILRMILCIRCKT